MLRPVSLLETVAAGAITATRSVPTIDIRPVVAVLVAIASLACGVVGAFILAPWAGWFALMLAGVYVEHRLTGGTSRGGSWAGP